jgi:hypothetical protein
MKKSGLLCLLLFPAIMCYSQEVELVEFLLDLNEAINNFDFSETEFDNFIILPSLYISRKRDTYASLGILLNNSFIGYFHRNSQVEIENPDDNPSPVITLLKAAFVFKRKKTNVTLYFDYFSDYSWGLSLKLRF